MMTERMTMEKMTEEKNIEHNPSLPGPAHNPPASSSSFFCGGEQFFPPFPLSCFCAPSSVLNHDSAILNSPPTPEETQYNKLTAKYCQCGI